jgi:thyroxine 5-deiodinase
MNSLSSFVDLAKRFERHADFAVVYLEEAHPTDGWMYDSVELKVAQHTSIDARMKCSEVMRSKLDEAGAVEIPLYVDTMANSAAAAFGALPERLVVTVNGKVAFIGGKGPMDYSVDKAEEALTSVLV